MPAHAGRPSLGAVHPFDSEPDMRPTSLIRSRSPAVLLTAVLTLPAAALASSHGTRVGAVAGVASMFFSGGEGSFESELQRSDLRGNQAQARGVLRDAALHAAALANQDQTPTCHLDPRTCVPSAATAQVEIWDLLTFTRSDLADPAVVRWRFDITGIENRGSPYFYAGLLAEAIQDGTAGFCNTARFFLELPPGVAFASSSGVFMADRLPPTPPVPEPPALTLGLAGLALLARRHRRACADRAR